MGLFPWTLPSRFRVSVDSAESVPCILPLRGGDADSDSEELILIPVEELRTKEMRKLKKWEN